MNTKSKIIVLHTLRYTDDKLIAQCLTPNAGERSFMLRVRHSNRAAVRHALFQPLAILELEWEEKSKGTILLPKSARIATPLPSLQSHPTKTTIALFLSEMLLHIVRNEEGGELLFSFIENSLEFLDKAETDYANFHLVFLIRLTLFLGIAPNTDRQDLPIFDLLAGEFSTTRPAHTHYIIGEEAQALGKLMRMNFATMHLFSLSRHQRGRILEIIITYYRLHLPSIPEIKSLEILRAVFS